MSAVQSTPHAALAVDTRQRIVMAFAAVVSRSGYAGAKISDVASEAHVSLRTLYAEFASKEDCFLELHRQVLDIMQETMRATLVFDCPWPEVMRRGFQTYFDVLTSQPLLTRAFLLELPTISEGGRRARQRAVEFFSSMLSEMIAEGQRMDPTADGRQLSDLECRALIGAVLELATSYADCGGDERKTEMVDVATAMLVNLVFGPPTSPAAN